MAVRRFTVGDSLDRTASLREDPVRTAAAQSITDPAGTNFEMASKNLNTLRESDDGLYFGSLLQDYPLCGVVTVDAQGRLTPASVEAEEMLRALAAGGPDAALMLPEPLLDTVRKVSSTGLMVLEEPCTVPIPGLPPALLSVTMTSLSGVQPGLVLVVLRNLSARDRLEQTLLRLDRLASLGTLSATMSHEMKNALVAIKTFADLLLEKHEDADLAVLVRRELGRLDAMLSNILKYAAPPRPTLSTLGLHEVLDHSLRLVQHRTNDLSIRLRRDYLAAPDVFLGDASQLDQAFINLLLNALEAMSSEGALSISTDRVPQGPHSLPGQTQEPQQLRVRISDTGSGMPPETARSAFDLFFTTKKGGTGLGLAITRGIIEDHGGTISIESQPGLGTTFTILLPAQS